MLIILAGITLNAVIGEGGIIFQARDTRNKISNETTYDNAQLAQLQNELKDNGLYSGIGIIPGTDNGGGSEGGENGTGSTNQGGSTNTGGNPNIGKDAETPNIVVLSGEELAEGIYQSDITVQIFNGDKTQKIKYVLATTVDEINKELYPSGLIKELEIENGGTLTFTKAGEYTITAYAYDTKGNKSEARSKKIKRLEGEKGIPNPPIFTASGIMGEPGYYSSDVVIKVEAETFTEIEKITYVVTGQAKTVGKIGEKEVAVGENILAEEVEIGNEETFEITADGIWTIKGYTYDTTGKKSEIAKGIIVAKDTIAPVAGVPVVSSGERGEPGYYRSDVTVKIQGYDDIGLKKVTYIVTGETKNSGAIGDIPVGNNQSVDTGEIEIENNGTFTITADGIYHITAYSYDKTGNKSEVSETLTLTRDTVPPLITEFKLSTSNAKMVIVNVTSADEFSGIKERTGVRLLVNGKFVEENDSGNFVVNNLVGPCLYNFSVEVTDKAGNKISSSVDGGDKDLWVDGGEDSLLIESAKIGDYVNYYCGLWPEEETSGTFTHRPGAPKSLAYYADGGSGWRYLGEQIWPDSNKRLTLVHASFPYLTTDGVGAGDSVYYEFINPVYASIARVTYWKENNWTDPDYSPYYPPAIQSMIDNKVFPLGTSWCVNQTNGGGYIWMSSDGKLRYNSSGSLYKMGMLWVGLKEGVHTSGMTINTETKRYGWELTYVD